MWGKNKACCAMDWKISEPNFQIKNQKAPIPVNSAAPLKNFMILFNLCLKNTIFVKKKKKKSNMLQNGLEDI